MFLCPLLVSNLCLTDTTSKLPLKHMNACEIAVRSWNGMLGMIGVSVQGTDWKMDGCVLLRISSKSFTDHWQRQQEEKWLEVIQTMLGDRKVSPVWECSFQDFKKKRRPAGFIWYLVLAPKTEENWVQNQNKIYELKVTTPERPFCFIGHYN